MFNISNSNMDEALQLDSCEEELKDKYINTACWTILFI